MHSIVKEYGFQGVAGFILFLAISYLLFIYVYTACFSPLAKFPGPKLWAACEIPLALSRLRGEGPSAVSALHEIYGPIVRVSPNELSYISSQAWKDIYGHRIGGRESFKKDAALLGRDASGVEGVIRAHKDEDHARQRQIFSHAFSYRALTEQEPLIKKYVSHLVALLQKKAKQQQHNPDEEVDMVKLYNYTTFDIMADLTFGEPLNLLEGDNYTPWVAAIFGNVKYLNMRFVLTRFPIFNKLFMLFFFPKSLTEQHKQHHKFAREKVDRRMAETTERPDIWNLVMRNENVQDIQRGELYSNSNTFMLAGTETTATLLSGLTYLLCKNPNAYQKLVKEIRQFSSPDELTIPNLQRLTYLQACLEEALRLYPPVPGGMLRIVPPEGATICGEHVPGGTKVALTHWAAYHSKQNFVEPETFKPERWTQEGGKKYENDDKEVFQPFSYGPRNCLGKNLAYHEMRMILASVLWHFDISQANDKDNWIAQKIYGLWEKVPLHVKLTPVKH